VIKTGATRASVAEERQPLNADSHICSTGVLIYAVDTAVAIGRPRIPTARGGGAQ
jgi:hypothetical protein